MMINGTQRAHTVYLFKLSGAGLSSIQITNASTGESVLWSNALNDGDWVRFSSATQRVEVSVNSGTLWTKNNANMTGKIPMLQGGEDNEITFTGPIGTYNVTYTARG